MSTKEKQTDEHTSISSEVVVSDAQIESHKAKLRALFTQPHDENRLNNLERETINQMVGYVVTEHQIDAETVWNIVTSKFNVSDRQHLAGRDYMFIMQFLVDMNPHSIIN